jgi:hypothetical protein
MQEDNIMNDHDKFKKLISTYFDGTCPSGYKTDDYYGIMIMKVKRNGRYQLRLQYDYRNRNMINGKPVEFISLDAALEAYRILEKFSLSGRNIEKQENIEEMLLAGVV